MKLSNRYVKRLAAMVVLSALVTTQSLASFADTQKHPKERRLTDEQQIIHVLNRLGFGARPGDVERVKSIGLQNYINQQLNPEKITDTVAENKLKDLSVLSMSTAELYEKYPQPGQLLRQLQARGMLPADLAEVRENRTKGTQNENQAPQMARPTPQPSQQPAPPLDPQNEKYRKVLHEYYQQNGLQQPQRIVAELQASRILRAVYSERQLQRLCRQGRRSLVAPVLRSRHDSSARDGQVFGVAARDRAKSGNAFLSR
jgi:hypothetical protein